MAPHHTSQTRQGTRTSRSTRPWTWDEAPAYDLTVDIVNEYLRGLFGNWNFMTEASHVQSPHFES